MVEHKKDAANVITKTEIDHHVILAGIYADTPAQKKLSKWMGYSSYLGCGHCMFLGKCGPTGHGMYFQGYEEARAAGWFRVCRHLPLYSCQAHVAFAFICPNPPHRHYAGPFWTNRNLDVKGSWGTKFCGDPSIKLTDAEQRVRADLVERGQESPKDMGCHGWSPPMRHLNYLDYNNLWIIPMSHALVYGVVKGFWKLLLTPPPSGI